MSSIDPRELSSEKLLELLPVYLSCVKTHGDITQAIREKNESFLKRHSKQILSAYVFSKAKSSLI